jgi:hypothetical protein
VLGIDLAVARAGPVAGSFVAWLVQERQKLSGLKPML